MPRFLITLSAVIILNSTFSIPNCFSETIWQPIGPFEGDVQAVAIDPTNSQSIFAGTSGGTVFRCFNPFLLCDIYELQEAI